MVNDPLLLSAVNTLLATDKDVLDAYKAYADGINNRSVQGTFTNWVELHHHEIYTRLMAAAVAARLTQQQ